MREVLQHTIKAFIRKGEKYYVVAECLEIPLVTQGKTLDEAAANLREAVTLHLEGEDLEQLGLAPKPTLIITIEREDLIEIAIAENRAKDKSRPFKDFLQDHIDAVLIEKAKKVKGKAVSASEYFTRRRKTGKTV